MRDAKRAAEYLFDEIGGIDDSYIAAAQSARRSGGATLRRTFSIAAAILWFSQNAESSETSGIR